jgi:hypothetical protein
LRDDGGRAWAAGQSAKPTPKTIAKVVYLMTLHPDQAGDGDKTQRAKHGDGRQRRDADNPKLAFGFVVQLRVS